MTASEIKAMQAEDDQLAQMMGKGEKMETLSSWDVAPKTPAPVPAGDCPVELAAKNDWRIKLPKSATYGLVFSILFFFFWACWMNGDISSRIGIPLMVVLGMAATSAFTLVWVKK